LESLCEKNNHKAFVKTMKVLSEEAWRDMSGEQALKSRPAQWLADGLSSDRKICFH